VESSIFFRDQHQRQDWKGRDIERKTIPNKMAPQAKTNIQGAALLKQLTFRISSTPVSQLPRVAAQVSASLWACRELLSSTAPSTKQNSDEGVTVHRFKTQLNTLLQDRTVEGRWSAVVLVKATVEAGGLEVLGKTSSWVKTLLTFLKKPDPSTTRSLAVITLVRIFMLTWDHANLVREITTPALPTFIATCLANIDNKRCSASELQTILEALITLLPRHPTTFRSAEKNIRDVLNRIISSTARSPASHHYLESHIQTSQKLLVLLHNCAPKQGAATKWDDTLKSTVNATHATCDRIFRSVVEDWRSVAGIQPSAPAHQLIAGEVEAESHDAVGLSGWKGIYEGGDRLVALIGLLQAHINNTTALSATVRIGLITDLTTRLLSVTVPAAGRQEFVKPNNQVSRDERESLYSVLPKIHAATLQLIGSLLNRFGAALMSILPSLTEQLTWVFKAERADEQFRTVAYSTLRQILEFAGHTFGKDEIADVTPFIAACCFDMLPEDDRTRLPTSQNGVQQSGSQVASQNSKPATAPATNLTAVQVAASALLPVFLSNLDTKCVPRKLRASIDRTAILTKHKEALVASVMNPPINPSGTGAQASLLPFLAKLFPGDAKVEALIRPRMPILWTGRRSGAEEEEDDEDEEEDQDIEMNGTDEMPQTDLLDALDEQLGNNKPTSAPVDEPTEESTEITTTTTSKRAAPSAPSPITPAKRLRASPVAESLMQTPAPQNLPGPDPVTAKTPVPTTVVTRSASKAKQQAVTLPAKQKAAPAAAATPAAAKPAAAAVDEDDGSDFEMPPLTMEGSDDEEEEGEDE
jgi:pre-rRNA-processing protein RIX1